MFLNKIIDIDIKNIKITNIDIDSRKITKGGLFFALKGVTTSGHNFIDNAIENGAAAVICHNHEENIEFKNNIPIYKTPKIFDLLIKSLHQIYPKLPKNIFAVTGTNGKSSVCYFIFQLLDFLGLKSAFIGTLGINSNVKISGLIESSLTTADIITLYKNLNILANNGVENIALEASSIGVEQGRLRGVDIALGAFTNFTQDHLDLHKSMENYFTAKMMLFNSLMKSNSLAILNSDIDEYDKITEICQKKNHQIFSYGKNGNFIKLLDAKSKKDVWNLRLEIFGKIFECRIKEIANFQIYNILCALSCVISYHNLSQERIEFLLQKLPELISVEGRMQKVVTLENSAKIFIDYAHTPDAIENILTNSKKIPHNKLHILFGSGGDRDKIKRPLMGKIASRLADKIIITDDNPRFEDGGIIRSEIIAACDISKVTEIADRREAIKYAVENLRDNDILLIAGKGHEKYQIIGDKKIEMDEKKIIMDAIHFT
jgi:UDP-N-acetylmuramoyl-L-alanyl-D-glutamate--2,6-diaminopimelate ligase